MERSSRTKETVVLIRRCPRLIECILSIAEVVFQSHHSETRRLLVQAMESMMLNTCTTFLRLLERGRGTAIDRYLFCALVSTIILRKKRSSDNSAHLYPLFSQPSKKSQQGKGQERDAMSGNE